MINIEKLHQVHKMYPNTPRRFGKTTYCYDSLLRASETGAYRELAYITTTTDFARTSFNDFIEFLDKQGETYKVISHNVVVVNDIKINFIGKAENKNGLFDGYVEDYFEDRFRPSTNRLSPREERIRRKEVRDRMDWILPKYEDLFSGKKE